jgi:hypothetical protein
MPEVGGKTYPYTEEGYAAADEAREEEGGTKVHTMSVEELSSIVRTKFETSRDFKQSQEELWKSAYDAYSAKYPTALHHSNELAEERGIFINLTRRKVQNAAIRITSMLLNDGKIPFTVKPSRKPRYMPADLEELDEGDKTSQLHTRSNAMERKIRDILAKTGYTETLSDIVHEMSLYGTGICKAVQLEQINYPVYTSVRQDEFIEEIESAIESEVVPTISFVSCWNIFPSPECTSFRNAEYVIQRSFLSSIDVRKLAESNRGFFAEQIYEALAEDKGKVEGGDSSEHPERAESSRTSERQKGFELLEFWGKLDAKDIGSYIDLDEGSMNGYLDVVITCLGDRVIRVAQNPFDGQIPFYSCTWQRSPERIWGDGIWYSVRDIQSVMNFSYAMMIEGKHLSSVPMTVIDPNAFEAGEDTERVQAGKQYRTKPGVNVNDAFRPVVIPDVTNGLIPLIQMLQRESDLDTGLAPIGMGQDSSYQTKTATGMSLLNTNANRQTASVVRSVSNMISDSITAMYRWLMVDSTDTEIKGDFEATCQGYERYVADEIHNTQLLSFLQVAGQSPQLQSYFNFSELAKPLARAFNMEPELIVKTDELVAQEQQQQMQTGMMMEKAKSEMEAQVKIAVEQAEGAVAVEVDRAKKLTEEKQKVSDDMRESEIKERLELIKQGNILKPSRLEDMSILINEEREEQEMAMMQEQLAAQQQQASGEGAPPPQEANGGSQGGLGAGSPEQDLMNSHESARLGNVIDGRMRNEQQLREGGMPASEQLRQNRANAV